LAPAYSALPGSGWKAAEPVARRRVGDVARHGLGAHAVRLGELGRELAQRLLAARDQRHAVSAAGELARERAADA
jgi:hypothetical protein